MKEGIGPFFRQPPQAPPQIGAGGEHLRGRPGRFQAARRIVAAQQHDLMPARRQKPRQLRAQGAGREIRQPPDIVQFLVSRPRRDNALHAEI